MTTLHFSGFPRVGAFRELKFAQEKYWRKEISEQELLAVAKDLREENWKHQAAANADYVAVGDSLLRPHPRPASCYRRHPCPLRLRQPKPVFGTILPTGPW